MENPPARAETPDAEKPKHRERRKPIRGGRGFHERLLHSNRKSDRVLASLHRKHKKLLAEKSKIAYEFALRPDSAELEDRFFETNAQVRSLTDAIRQRQEKMS